MKEVSVYLPKDQTWYDLRSGTAYKGGKTQKMEVTDADIPVFQRSGTIIPRKDRFRRSTVQMENDPYTLVHMFKKINCSRGSGKVVYSYVGFLWFR